MLLDLLILKDAEGQKRRRLTLTDMTEFKQVQQNLEESQAKLGHLNQTLEQQVKERTLELEQRSGIRILLLSVADLKTPLRAIQGFPACCWGSIRLSLMRKAEGFFRWWLTAPN